MCLHIGKNGMHDSLTRVFTAATINDKAIVDGEEKREL